MSSSAFLGSMIEYYGELSQKATQRLNAARTKIDAGTYGADELTSDALGVWLDVVEGWWDSALRPVVASLPVAFLNVQVGNANSPQVTIAVKLTQAGAVASSHLNGKGNDFLNATNHVIARFKTDPGGNADRTQLEVQLKSLTSYNGTPNTNPPAGVYQGVAYVDQTAIAQIVALIRP